MVKKSTKSTKKAGPKKAFKVVKEVKEVIPKKAKKATKNPGNRIEDRKRAKVLGLSLVSFRVLRSLKSGQLSYRQIERATGYYSVLAGVMHTDEKAGLVPLGLARMGTNDIDGRDKKVFGITAKGKKLLEKKSPAAK